MPGFSFLASCTPSSFAVALSVGSFPVLGSVDDMCCSVANLVVEVAIVVSRGLVLVCSSVGVEEAFVNGIVAVSFCVLIAVVASEVGLPLKLVAGVVGVVVVPSDGEVVAVVVLLLIPEVLVVALLAPVNGNVAGLAVETTVGVVSCVSFVVLPRLVGAVVYIKVTFKVAYGETLVR